MKLFEVVLWIEILIIKYKPQYNNNEEDDDFSFRVALFREGKYFKGKILCGKIVV